VISNVPEPDIAALPAPVEVLEETLEQAVPDAPVTTRPTSEPAGGDTAPLSGGDDLVNVERAIEDAQAATRPAPDRAPAGGEAEVEAGGNAQYHDEIPRYQSPVVSDENSWSWDWYLEMDCDGVVSSISHEVGDSASDDWNWNWVWNWSCGLDGGSENARDELRATAPDREPDGQTGAREGGAPQGGERGQEADASWLWTWTFTFCGHETTISTRTAVDPTLRWAWNWAWTWACTDSTSTDEGPGAGDTPQDADAPLPWIDEFMRFEDAEKTDEALVDALLGHELLTPFAVPLSLLPIPDLAAPPSPTPRAAPLVAAAESARPRPGRPTLTGWAEPEAVEEHAAPTQASERASHRRAAPEASSPRQRGPKPPRGTFPRRVAGTPSSSGSAPSGTGGGGSSGGAVLTGLFVLAAPGLGRRIRETRELSPRAPVRARLERPG
jgi:hypothetical protein